MKLKELLKNFKKRGKIIILLIHIKSGIEELADVVYKFDGGNLKLNDD